jgi:hypothetical protein
MMGGVGMLPWALALATLGCNALKPSSIGPEGSDAVWREFRSDHFVVSTDADVKEVQESLVEFETTYRALMAVLFHEEGDAREPMCVVLFAHSADLHRFIPTEASAAFSRAQPGDPGSRPTMLVETSLSDDGRRLFVHEMTHAFVERWLGLVPLWLDEGLAQYFETMRIERGRIVLGEPAGNYGLVATQLPGLTALITADRAAFYAGHEASVEGLYRQGSYYAASWFLVRMLMQDGGDYHRRFYRYLDALTQRVPPQAAWARSFDGATYRRLAHDYLEYFRSEFETGAVAVDVTAPTNVVWAQRILPAEETRSLWARLGRAARRP